ncbi:unannotated protein [freshwater metagenome]|uniref:Unannotated protein n=1 Tax=freshwater metagenome TaxID=449393 RepID=A0A6J7HYE5_9ZZZZ|nr:MBL fold metallo-hydrolase [Actinomycetota bacterium]
MAGAPTPTLWDPTSAEAQQAEREGVIAIPVPTPFAVGPINCYLLEDDPLTLVDSGPNSGPALDTIERALAARGHRIEDLELLVITHQHIDHLGLIRILAERSGADVAAIDVLAPWLARFSRLQEADDAFSEAIMARNGIPEHTRLALLAVSAAYRGWGAPATVTRPLRDGERLELRDRSFDVHLRPGHSPSDTVFHDRERGMLIGGDHLLAHISSNPLIARPLADPVQDAATARDMVRPQSLRIYLDSLAATRAMTGVDLILPGHGPAITDYVPLIDERTEHHERRARRIHRLIADRPRTAFEIAQEIWGKVAITQAYLTLSEVLGHVDLLLNDGLVREEPDGDGVVRFESLSPPPARAGA